MRRDRLASVRAMECAGNTRIYITECLQRPVDYTSEEMRVLRIVRAIIDTAEHALKEIAYTP